MTIPLKPSHIKGCSDSLKIPRMILYGRVNKKWTFFIKYNFCITIKPSHINGCSDLIKNPLNGVLW